MIVDFKLMKSKLLKSKPVINFNLLTRCLEFLSTSFYLMCTHSTFCKGKNLPTNLQYKVDYLLSTIFNLSLFQEENE